MENLKFLVLTLFLLSVKGRSEVSINVCEKGYVPCLSANNEGACASQKECILNYTEDCQYPCFDDVFACFNVSCKSVTELTDKIQFCKTACKPYLEIFDGPKLSMTEKLTNFDNQWKSDSCIGLCSIGQSSEEEEEKKVYIFKDVYLTCLTERTNQTIIIRDCAYSAYEMKCNKKVKIRLFGGFDWNPFQKITELKPDGETEFVEDFRIDYREDFGRGFKGHSYGENMGFKRKRAATNILKKNSCGEKLCNRTILESGNIPVNENDDKRKRFLEGLCKDICEKKIEINVNNMCYNYCKGKNRKDHRLSDFIYTCNVTGNSTDLSSKSGVQCKQTKISCIFQDMICEGSKTNDGIVYFNHIWSNTSEKIKRNSTCDSMVVLKFDGHIARNKFLRFSCKDYEHRKYDLPPFLYYDCVSRWYGKDLIVDEGRSCNTTCVPPKVICDTFKGSLCLQTLRECNFLFGRVREKNLKLITSTHPIKPVSLRNLYFIRKKEPGLLKVVRTFGLSDVHWEYRLSGDGADKWKKLSTGSFLNYSMTELRINPSNESMGIAYVVLTKNASDKGIGKKENLTRTIAVLYGYEYPYETEKIIVDGKSKISVKRLLPMKLYAYLKDNQMLLENLINALNVDLLGTCNVLLKKVASPEINITLNSTPKSAMIWHLPQDKEYKVMKAGVVAKGSLMSKIMATDLTFSDLEEPLNITLTLSMDVNYYSSLNSKPFVWSSFLSLDPDIVEEKENKGDNKAPTLQWWGKFYEEIVMVPFEEPNEGFFVGTLANTFYEDIDEDDLGIAVLLAQSASKIGRWQYAPPKDDWKDITEIPEVLNYFKSMYFQSNLSANEGPLGISQNLYRSMCHDYINPCNLSISGCEYVDMEFEWSLNPLKKMNSHLANMDLILETSPTQLSILKVTLFPSDYRLRYQPYRENTSWNYEEAFLSTNLIFTAWDRSDNKTPESETTIKLPHCCRECGESNSLSRDFYRINAKKQDCHGGPVIDKPSGFDQCGVCGGDNDCKDCMGNVKRGHKLQCGKCIPLKENITDCNGGCGEHIIMIIKGNEVCVPKKENDNSVDMACDGLPVDQSGAKINVCGICFGGKTNRSEYSGLDRCGKCTNGRRKSFYFDQCICDKKGCETFQWDNVYPRLIDLSIGPAFSLSLSHANLSKIGDDAFCVLKNNNSGSILSLIVEKEQVSSHISVTFTNVSKTGSYMLQCYNADNRDRPIFTEDELCIVDSREVVLESVNAIALNQNAYRILLNLKKPLRKKEGSKLCCFFLMTFEGDVKLDAVLVNETVVDCGFFYPLSGEREIRFGVLLDPIVPLEKPNLMTLPATFPRKTPIIKKGILLSDGQTVIIQFTMNIEGTDDCTELFNSNTLKMIDFDQERSSCEIVADMIRIRLGPKSKVTGGSILNFIPTKIRGQGADSSQSIDTRFFGSVQVSFTGQRDTKPKFILRGRNSFCPDTHANFSAVKLRGLGAGSLIWNLRFKNGSSVHPDVDRIITQINQSNTGGKKKQKSKKHHKNGKKKNRGANRSIVRATIESKYLTAGERYILRVIGESYDSKNQIIQSLPKSLNFTVIPVTTPISIGIAGPRKSIQANKPLRLKAKVKNCATGSKFKKTYQGVKYLWTSKPLIPELSEIKNRKNIKLRKGLVGGKKYFMTLTIEARSLNKSETFKASATIRITTLLKGPKAQIPVKAITFGVENDVILDGDSSINVDNLPGELQFEWFCKHLENNAGCFVSSKNKDDVPILLKQWLQPEVMMKSRLVIPKKTLIPAKYNFTLRVSSDNGLESKSNVIVHIVPGKICSIEFATLNDQVDVSSKTVVKALIKNAPGSCATWDCVKEKSFPFVNLASVSKSGGVRCFKGRVKDRMFNLVIPPKILRTGVTYKFVLTVTSEKLGTTGSALTVLRTQSQPPLPFFKVNPSEGIAMSTSFYLEFEEDSELDDDGVYFYRLYYGTSEDSMVYLSDSIDTEFLLPGSDDLFHIYVKTCNEFYVCTVSRSENEVDVTMDNDFDKPQISGLLDLTSQFAAENECLPAISFIASVVATIKVEKALWKQYGNIVCLSFYGTFLKCGKFFSQSIINEKDYESVTIAMKLFIDSGCIEAYNETIRINKKKDFTSKVRTNAMASLNDINSQILQSALEEVFTNSTFYPSRRKRETDSNKKLPLLDILTRSLTNEQMGIMIEWSMKSISSSSSAKDELKLLIEQIVTEYMKALCRTTDAQSAVEVIKTDDVDLSVLNTELMSDGRFNVGSKKTTENIVYFEEMIRKRLSEWDCSSLLTCAGFSLGTVEIKMSSNVVSELPGKEPIKVISSIFGVHLLNPYTCDPISTLDDENLRMSLKVKDYEEAKKIQAETSFQMHCMVLEDEKWNLDACKTDGFTPKSDGGAVVYCRCSVAGYIAIGMVNSNNELTILPEKHSFHKIVQFRINEKYEDIMAENNEESLKKSLLERLDRTVGIKYTQVKNLSFGKGKNGNVTVKFVLFGEGEIESAKLHSSHSDLRELFQIGKFRMKGLNGNPLNIPSQCIDDCVDKTPTKWKKIDYLPIILACIAIFLVVTIVIFIFCAIQAKKKRLEEKVKPLVSGTNSSPNYRSLQYVDSLQGTVDTFKKFNHRETKFLRREYDKNVVPPAGYKTPIPKMSNRIETVYPEMVLDQYLKRLPGTPENK